MKLSSLFILLFVAIWALGASAPATVSAATSREKQLKSACEAYEKSYDQAKKEKTDIGGDTAYHKDCNQQAKMINGYVKKSDSDFKKYIDQIKASTQSIDKKVKQSKKDNSKINSDPNDFNPDLSSLPDASTDPDKIRKIVGIVFGIAGALALLFIVIGGLRYILSAGNPESSAQAKNTIVYALVGLVITITAYGIVAFVVSNV